MKTQKIDALNILLITVSLFLAFKVPFQLFLFSYAVLGPLHYLTQINWLQEKNYFITSKNWSFILVFFAIIITIPLIINLPVLQGFKQTYLHKSVLAPLLLLKKIAILSAFIFAIGLIHLKKWQYVLCFFVLSVILSALVLKYVPFLILWVSVFVPTLFHVYVFTLLFMVYGYLKSKSTFGLLAIILLILCPLIIVVSNITPSTYLLPLAIKNTFLESGFGGLNKSLAKVLGQKNNNHFSVFSLIGIKIQVFISFAYTYHYLNWFSKTTIIGWAKQIYTPKFIGVIILWFTSVFLYYYDYKTGLLALFFLSFLHVLLEFPLNIEVIKHLSTTLFKYIKLKFS